MRVNGHIAGAIQIPLAPIAEQRRIVARIDELLAEIAEGEAALARARQGLETWRRSLLKAAVTGELTRDWREANKPTETGADLLARIRAERAKLVLKPTRARAEGSERLDISSLPELPNGWAWARMRDVTVGGTRNGISVKGSDQPPGTPALRLDALSNAGIDYTRVRYIHVSREKVNALALCERDFPISRANGSEHLVGKSRLVRSVPLRCVFPDTIIRYRIGGPSALGEWLELIWEGGLIRTQIRAMGKTTAGILTHQSVIKTTLLYLTAGSAIIAA
jgi:type I restriction enzyme S subunit